MVCNDEKVYRIVKLLVAWRVGMISEEDLQELETWRHESPENAALYDQWKDDTFLAKNYKKFKAVDGSDAMRMMQGRIREGRRRRFRVMYVRCGVAAAVLFALFGGFYGLLERGKVVRVEPQVPIALIQPKRPVLKLDNGTVMTLDSTWSDRKEAGVILKKAGDMTLSYVAEDSLQKSTLSYNTVEVPKGAEFDLVLADGTQVWLNADSKLTYPVVFGQEEREVVLQGEAFFKVKRDVRRPFRVKTERQTLEVLGTEFNMDAYPGEENIYTTLVTGSVKVISSGKSVILTPGMQAVVGEGNLFTREIDPEDVVSWRNGMFVIEERTLEEVMCKLARWYDFSVFYQDQEIKNICFKGRIPRYESFKSILNILEKTGGVKFNVQGREVTVSR